MTEDITWQVLAEADLIDYTDKRADNYYGEEWIARNDRTGTTAAFGLCPDPHGIVPEGEHTGWAVMYEYDDGSEVGPVYYEPENLSDMLADVRQAIAGEE